MINQELLKDFPIVELTLEYINYYYSEVKIIACDHKNLDNAFFVLTVEVYGFSDKEFYINLNLTDYIFNKNKIDKRMSTLQSPKRVNKVNKNAILDIGSLLNSLVRISEFTYSLEHVQEIDSILNTLDSEDNLFIKNFLISLKDFILFQLDSYANENGKQGKELVFLLNDYRISNSL